MDSSEWQPVSQWIVVSHGCKLPSPGVYRSINGLIGPATWPYSSVHSGITTEPHSHIATKPQRTSSSHLRWSEKIPTNVPGGGGAGCVCGGLWGVKSTLVGKTPNQRAGGLACWLASPCPPSVGRKLGDAFFECFLHLHFTLLFLNFVGLSRIPFSPEEIGRGFWNVFDFYTSPAYFWISIVTRHIIIMS